MNRRDLFSVAALAALVFIFLPVATRSQEPAPWIGTWNLNAAKSSNRPGSPFKRETLRINPWEDGVKVVYDLVGVRGGITHIEWTGRFDGKDYPLQGVDEVLTNAYRRTCNNAYEIVVKRDGTIVATTLVTISPDGKTLRAETAGKAANGENTNSVAVYDRQ
jgi:hypothetical protein